VSRSPYTGEDPSYEVVANAHVHIVQLTEEVLNLAERQRRGPNLDPKRGFPAFLLSQHRGDVAEDFRVIGHEYLL
jgi:hypothetical protein